MHAILFGLKRGFQASLRLARPFVTPFGLTPARFDLLHVVHGFGTRIHQSTLRRTLGVTAPTVTRMLQSLEALGFIRRERSHDKRCLIVLLTEIGLRLIRRAMRTILGQGALHFAFECAINAHTERASAEALFRSMSDFDDSLLTLRANLLDTGSVYYPWHPDD